MSPRKSDVFHENAHILRARARLSYDSVNHEKEFIPSESSQRWECAIRNFLQNENPRPIYNANGGRVRIEVMLDGLGIMTGDRDMFAAKIQNNPKTVLVVDDSQDMVVLLKSILKGRGHCVLTASNPHQAFQLFQDHPEIELIIIDIHLKARENGVALASKFHRFSESRHFSMCLVSSSHVDESFIEAVHKIGVEDFIPKPINMQRFQTKVEDLLGFSLKNIDQSRSIVCRFSCEIIESRFRQRMALVEITPNSFLLHSSSGIDVGEILSIRCTSLQSILDNKIFTIKIQQSRLGFDPLLPMELRVQLVDPEYSLRLKLESLFERSKLPEGMSFFKAGA